MADIFKLSDAGASVIQVRTRESIRTALIMRKNLIDGSETSYREWDVVNGIRVFERDNYTNNALKGGGEQFFESLMEPLNMLRDTKSHLHAQPEKIHYYIYVNPHPYIANNPIAAELITQYAAILPSTNVCIIFVTPEVAIDGLPSGTLLVADLKTPTASELGEALETMLSKAAEDFDNGHDISEDDVAALAQLGLGLTLFQFETYSALAIVGASLRKEETLTTEMLTDGIAVGKTEVVKQSEILELYPTVSMDEVGGMNRLKDWVTSRANCYSEEAREFGIESPKGITVVGVPGSGKSLVAKAIAAALGVPLVRLDFGRVFSKFVGDSEGRIRAALAMVEAMAPCVLFVDEIDKGLGGASGGGDGGTTSRVLGSYLTWLNDCKAPVFNMVTANKVEGLPPELLRKGRFDQIFSVGMPGRAEREEVLHIHLKKRGHEMEFSGPEMAQFYEKSDQYVPAEIEAAVRDSLILAFNGGEDLSMTHIVDALENMVPMSTSNKAQIDAIVAWSAQNAIPVAYEETAPTMALAKAGAATANGGRRINRRSAK